MFAPTPSPGATLNYNSIAQQYGMGQSAAATQAAPGASGSTKDPQILWDFDSEHTMLDQHGPRNIAIKKSLSSLLSQFDQMSIDEKRQMAGFLTIAGYLSNASDNSWAEFDSRALLTPLTGVRDAYAKLLTDAAAKQAAPYNQTITPMQLLREQIGYRLSNAGIKWNGNLDKLGRLTGMTVFGGSGGATGATNRAKTGAAGYGGTGSKKANTTIVQKASTIDIMDPMDAKGLTRSMLQQELGRDPTQAEYDDFVAMLMHAQRANPTTQTQTTTYDANGTPINQSSVTHQGINQTGLDQLAYEKAQQNPDYAEWQAMGTYAPAFFDALGATVPGVGPR